MTQEEFVKDMAYMGLAYNKEFTKDQLGVWYPFFAHESDQDYRKAITRLITKSKYLPSIAELKEELMTIQNPETQLDPDKEWSKVERAIAKYGFYNSEEAVKSLEPFTALVVHRMGGFRKICLSEDGDWTRKNFLRLWADAKDGDTQVLLMSEKMLTLPELARLAEMKTSGLKRISDGEGKGKGLLTDKG